jgi:hypothetical protein
MLFDHLLGASQEVDGISVRRPMAVLDAINNVNLGAAEHLRSMEILRPAYLH